MRGKSLKKFYITTPIYYVNAPPHLGHAYTIIAADVLARYKRLKGYKVFFLTGTDEHGNKIAQAAKKRGIKPIELADKMASRYQKLWEKLHISYDDFIRTTQSRHIKVVKNVFQKLYEQKDIYKGNYEGWYCVPCESFWLKSQLKEGNLCPDCGRKVEKIKEECYYFNLSRYEKRLFDYIEKNPDFIQPPARRNEVIEFIKRGLRDVCITRLNLEWGIPCPVEEKHTIYVWTDALLNYISALGYSLDGEKFSLFWPADIHLLGKDIIRFHCIIWPALLMALGINLPHHIFAHGWWKIKGEKMSKSKANVIDPQELAQNYGTDALRYFLLREIPFGEDGNFSMDAFIKRINSDLANDLGNLLNRTLPLIEKYSQGKIPPYYEQREEDIKLREKVEKVFPSFDEEMEKASFSKALSLIWEIVKSANLYIDKSSPWREAKEKEGIKHSHTVLYNLSETLRLLGLLLFPFIPQSAEKMWNQLGIKEKLEEQTFDKAKKWGFLSVGTKINKGAPLFPRIQK